MMNELYFHIEYFGTIISNFPNDLIHTIPKQDGVSEKVLCRFKGVDMRHKKQTTPNGYIYLRSYDKNITNKIFSHYFKAFTILYETFIEQLKTIQQASINDVHRLQHNVNTYNAKIKDDLDNLISIDDLKINDWKQIVPYAENIIRENIRLAAVTFLKIVKNNSLVNAEMNVYELLDNPERTLDLYNHPIHKVVKLSLQPYFMEFVDKKIYLDLGSCYSCAFIDYSSISVVFGHIWSNAIKYCKDGSAIDITFDADENHIYVKISMNSIKINTDELIHIYEEGYSGYWAKIVNKQGKGIGMYYIDKLIKMNNGSFQIIPGEDITYYDSIPYAINTMIISLPKSAD